MASTPRTSLQLYRDCLRLIQHVAPGSSPKGVLLRSTVRTEFRKHKDETDAVKIETYKSHAIRALSNYLLAMNALKDEKVKHAVDDFHQRSIPNKKTAPSKQQQRQEK